MFSPKFTTIVLLLLFAQSAVAFVEHRCIHDNITALSGTNRLQIIQDAPTNETKVDGNSHSRSPASTLSPLSSSGSLPLISVPPKKTTNGKPHAPNNSRTESEVPYWFIQSFPQEKIVQWSSLRVKFFTADLDNGHHFCQKASEKRATLLGESRTCTERDVLTPRKKEILLSSILPNAIKLHTERLKVNSLSHPIIVPKFHHICSHFTVAPDHHVTGVSDADLVFYIAAAPTPYSTMAWSLACATLTNGRPVIGVLNFSPSYITDTAYAVRVAAHEMAHVLGFNYGMMKEKNMIYSSLYERNKRHLRLVNSTTVVEKVRKHYDCESVKGMELENENGHIQHYGSIKGDRSHWERRHAKDELMSPILSIGYYTSLTMAVFSDLGYYKVDWEKAEPMTWGWRSKCDLLLEKCIVSNMTKFPHMFCNSTSSTLRCTSDRQALGNCPIHLYNAPLSPTNIYFTPNNIFGSPESLTDYCPVITAEEPTACINGIPSLMPGSKIGPSSWCAAGENLQIHGKSVGDVCVEVECTGVDALRVRYLGDDTWHPCPQGTSIAPNTKTSRFTAGRIVCPKYSEVCVVVRKRPSLHNGDYGPMEVIRTFQRDRVEAKPVSKKEIVLKNTSTPSHEPTTIVEKNDSSSVNSFVYVALLLSTLVTIASL